MIDYHLVAKRNVFQVHFLSIFPVQSFKLEPLSQGSYLTVDGELIEHSNIRAEVVSKAIKILTKS